MTFHIRSHFVHFISLSEKPFKRDTRIYESKMYYRSRMTILQKGNLLFSVFLYLSFFSGMTIVRCSEKLKITTSISIHIGCFFKINRDLDIITRYKVSDLISSENESTMLDRIAGVRSLVGDKNSNEYMAEVAFFVLRASRRRSRRRDRDFGARFLHTSRRILLTSQMT